MKGYSIQQYQSLQQRPAGWLTAVEESTIKDGINQRTIEYHKRQVRKKDKELTSVSAFEMALLYRHKVKSTVYMKYMIYQQYDNSNFY